MKPGLFSTLLADNVSYGFSLVPSARDESRVVYVYHIYAGHLDWPRFAGLSGGSRGLVSGWGSQGASGDVE